MSSDENKAASAAAGSDKPTEDDGAKKAVADMDDDEDRVCNARKPSKVLLGTKYDQVLHTACHKSQHDLSSTNSRH